MATDKNLQNLIINKLTKQQYDALDSPSPDELYLVPDEIDDTPTQNSDNPVKSGGVFTALAGKQDTIADLADIRSGSQENVKYTQQTLTDAQKAQARTNIGAGTYTKPSTGIPASDLASGVIPAEIDTVNVTVDNATGTPSASGSVSGGTLSLSFSNLKGAKGDTGATGATGPQGPKGDKGDQGNTGSSVAYPYELVNNLTTDDATKGLSAAMGKVLGDEIDTVIKPKFDYPFSVNGYLNTSGEVTSFWNGSSTDFIEAEVGDDFFFTGQTTGAFQNVCAYNASKGFIRVLYKGAGNNTKITITDPTIAYVRACANKDDSGKVFTKMNYDSLGTLSGKVDDLVQKIEPTVIDNMTTGYVEDYYINHDGALSGNSSFGYKEFTVRAGAMISITIAEHSNIAAIAKKLSEGKYVELVPATTFGEAVTHTYTATEDMTIAVSFYQTSARSITITTDYINSNRLNIVALQQEDASDEIRDIDFGFFFDKIAVIGDSMAIATMDGYSPTTGSAWLSFLAKRWNCTGKQFYAMGGTGAYDWLNSNTYGLGKMLADETVYNAYFIAYGHNDAASVGEATDAAAPVTVSGGVPSCPSGYSFCAYLKAIVAQIREKAPHAMIFMLSQYDYSVAPGGWHSSYGEAVIAVAEALYAGGDKLVHHLDTGGVPDADMRIGSHYSTVGYAYIAKRVNDEVNKVMYQYRADTEIKTFGVYNL
jgi:hypothetical protein